MPLAEPVPLDIDIYVSTGDGEYVSYDAGEDSSDQNNAIDIVIDVDYDDDEEGSDAAGARADIRLEIDVADRHSARGHTD